MWSDRRRDDGLKAAEALSPRWPSMAFSQSHIMAARRHQHSRLIIEVDEYSSNPTQAFTFYNINQGRFQPPHVQMVDPVPHDAPKPPGYTRFVCVSDTHSRTDPIQMPYGDVLIHAGDFTELGLPSEVKKFNEWLGSLPYEYKIVIAGNHELTFDQEFMADLIKQDFYYFPSVSKLKPENYENVQSLLTNCIYLQDSEVTVRGFRIYGSPWQPWFYGWGFNLPRGQALLEKWNLIPEGIDILITHGPPLGQTPKVPLSSSCGRLHRAATEMAAPVPTPQVTSWKIEEIGFLTDTMAIRAVATSGLDCGDGFDHITPLLNNCRGSPLPQTK
ncbi:metallophosphoesterase domain-containing protein 1 [Petaurus breviceps papuanus]|uniref:metallophosphoesterase domain-containing protein 1 n=1 Tax=Petaurus breviceps papuanus TaxID=3040969 RepID=UPI0036DC8845